MTETAMAQERLVGENEVLTVTKRQINVGIAYVGPLGEVE